jgi:hypothetical protein
MRAALYPGRAGGGGIAANGSTAKLPRNQAALAFSASLPGKEIVVSAGAKSRKYLLICRGLLRLRRISFYLGAPVDYPELDP